jgi:hypothetical protein
MTGTAHDDAALPDTPAPRVTTYPAFPCTVAAFRAFCPAFADPAQYPDEVVQMWLDLASHFVNSCWGPMQGAGQAWWAAHEMAKMESATKAALGGNPGGVSGVISSKSVGPVSVSYDTQIGVVEKAGPYNLTMYGRQYAYFANLFGMGPFQFGPPEPAPQSPWIGPVPYLYYF